VIILDTNQLERSQPPDGPLIAMLQALGKQTGHQLWLPELVFEEHLAHYRRDVEGASARCQTAESDLIRLIPDLRRHEQLLPDVDRAVEDRSQRLQAVFQIRPTPDEAAHEALLREARRKPPAKTSQDGQGSGARDVAIWLTAISACEESAEHTYFVSTDNNAFGKENLKSELVEELQLRLGATANMFHYCYGLDVLLSQLATRPSADVSFDMVVNDVRVKAAVASSCLIRRSRRSSLVPLDCCLGSAWLPRFRASAFKLAINPPMLSLHTVSARQRGHLQDHPGSPLDDS
jgi:hypothetical protein